MLALNSNPDIVWYNPPFGAPTGSSTAARYLRRDSGFFRSLELLTPLNRIGEVVERILTVIGMIIDAVFDLIIWIWPIRRFDSLEDEVHQLISILVFPFFALMTPFGYFPKVDLSRGSLDIMADTNHFELHLLFNEELFPMTQAPRFWRRVQQSSWLTKRDKCRGLMFIAIRANNHLLFRQVAQAAKQNGIFHELMGD